MKWIVIGAALVAAAGVVPALADTPLVGIVSISATEANNARYIVGAKAAAKEIGWDVSVIDAAGSADQANAAIQNFAQRGSAAIVDMVFPYSSIGAGLQAAKSANIPVVTWGGGLGSSVAATNGSGGPMVVPVDELMLKAMSGKGSILALTYHTGEVCRNREVELDKALAANPDIKVTKNEVRIPGYFEDGAQYANAWLASHPAGQENLAIWGCWDDPAIGAIGSLRAQGRDDVKVYGVNGNAQALENIKNGFMTATAWQDSYTEGYNMIKLLPEIRKAGADWKPKAVEVPAVLVTKDTIDDFIAKHPDAMK
ncbi:sugar ABC transporter substrate-binding protein [Mesorhizobium sp.]|jgi:ribose transport system substrate-binding protein|uniref:sugar ABC transporter substrate-binding protein n=1 Tax=Mesorhizobium sp. TaxID=1871066 RepID=UPI000FE2E020|nr:sugar ABC transporter substrate-binding protein [Mesorhizobium sp.]RWH69083.1 MAG: sugar ABC transporter substrate-binding protein [Mesorhizobium sp.]RWL26234.1 MAG: sugar ABC transporter substrate-binding protein [Mesorhizobium sp.]RWL26856.1 MAG: sugar ABC transporter substrate-binding protein [Mesorhizobium sp.]RWL37981.1 MAG: sugar ABC transporter substrate-binding protein [Mesorhizobium sp.]RWL56913.1 MAG: sugar ABC transporter substrate-binding protein [Mesorhizobium sp.]